MKKCFNKLLLLLSVLFFLWVIPSQSVVANTTATLTNVKGEVIVTKSGGKMEFVAFNKMELQQGYSIRTGKESSVKINFGNGTEATLGEYGNITLAELKSRDSTHEFSISSARNNHNVSIKQESGGLWTKVKNLMGAGNRHRTETSTAIMGVRGTLFLTIVDGLNQKESVSVLEGTVGIEKANGYYFSQNQEPKVMLGNESTLNKENDVETRLINYLELFNKIDEILATTVLLDTIEIAKDTVNQAENINIQDKDSAKKSLELVVKAELLSILAEQVVKGAMASNKSAQINLNLQDSQQSLQQLEQTVMQMKQNLQETRKVIEEAATQLGLSEQEIKNSTEALDKIKKELEQKTTVIPTPISDSGSYTPKPITTDAEKVGIAKSNLTLGDTTEVTTNLTLPTTQNEVMVSWSTSNSSVISTTGVVTRPTYTEGNQTVTLTATLTAGAASETKVFTLMVLALPATDVEKVGIAKSNLTLGDTTEVTTNLTLPTAQNEAIVSWSTSNSSVISTTGVVTRPTYTEGNQSVTLTATLTVGTAIETKTFTVNVLAYPAIYLNGLGSFAYVNNYPEIEMSGQDHYSISLWVKPESHGTILSKGLGGAHWPGQLRWNLNYNEHGNIILALDAFSAGGWGHYGNFIVPLGEWVHLTIVKTNTHISFYKNGTIEKTEPLLTIHQNSNAALGDMRIGVTDNSDNPFKGYINDLTIWKSALQPTDVVQLMNNSKAVISGQTCAAKILFNEGIGTTSSNECKSGFDAILTSDQIWSLP